MPTNTKGAKPEAAEGTPLTVDTAEQLAALQQQNEQLQAMLAEVLGRKAVAAETPAAEEVPSLPTRKLLFTDRSTLRPNEVYGPIYTCAKGGTPVIFKGDMQGGDKRPHAFVHESFGDYLIAYDRQPEGPARYEWAVD